MIKNGMRPIHPGEILREEYLEPLGMTPHALAKGLNLPASRVNDIVLERRGITPETALRLARFFRTTAEFWLSLQQTYSLKVAEREVLDQVIEEVQPLDIKHAA